MAGKSRYFPADAEYLLVHCSPERPGVIPAFGYVFNGIFKVTHRTVRQAFCQFSDFVFGHPHCLSHIADRRTKLKRVKCTDHRHLVIAVFSIQVIEDNVAPFPANVDVDVGRFTPFRIQEPLKVKIEPDWVGVRDSEYV